MDLPESVCSQSSSEDGSVCADGVYGGQRGTETSIFMELALFSVGVAVGWLGRQFSGKRGRKPCSYDQLSDGSRLDSDTEEAAVDISLPDISSVILSSPW